jgi:hypothetical protein
MQMDYASVTLDFRKTHQSGGVVPFVLHRRDDKPWLCYVRALLTWIACRGVQPGYLFLTINGNDKIVEGNKPLVCLAGHSG